MRLMGNGRKMTISNKILDARKIEKEVFSENELRIRGIRFGNPGGQPE
jgi:hypothetical protein